MCRGRGCRTEGGGRKINEYMPPFTPYSSRRVRLSGETSGWEETDRGKGGRWSDLDINIESGVKTNGLALREKGSERLWGSTDNKSEEGRLRNKVMLVGGRWSGPLQSELFIEIPFLSAQFALNSPKFIIHCHPSPYVMFGLRLMLSIYTWCLWCGCLILSFTPPPHLSGRVILNAWACCSETSLRPTLSLQQKNTTNHVK